jgi:hypothetical protein
VYIYINIKFEQVVIVFYLVYLIFFLLVTFFSKVIFSGNTYDIIVSGNLNVLNTSNFQGNVTAIGNQKTIINNGFNADGNIYFYSLIAPDKNTFVMIDSTGKLIIQPKYLVLDQSYNDIQVNNNFTARGILLITGSCDINSTSSGNINFGKVDTNSFVNLSCNTLRFDFTSVPYDQIKSKLLTIGSNKSISSSDINPILDTLTVNKNFQCNGNVLLKNNNNTFDGSNLIINNATGQGKYLSLNKDNKVIKSPWQLSSSLPQLTVNKSITIEGGETTISTSDFNINANEESFLITLGDVSSKSSFVFDTKYGSIISAGNPITIIGDSLICQFSKIPLKKQYLTIDKNLLISYGDFAADDDPIFETIGVKNNCNFQNTTIEGTVNLNTSTSNSTKLGNNVTTITLNGKTLYIKNRKNNKNYLTLGSDNKTVETSDLPSDFAILSISQQSNFKDLILSNSSSSCQLDGSSLKINNIPGLGNYLILNNDDTISKTNWIDEKSFKDITVNTKSTFNNNFNIVGDCNFNTSGQGSLQIGSAGYSGDIFFKTSTIKNNYVKLISSNVILLCDAIKTNEGNNVNILSCDNTGLLGKTTIVDLNNPKFNTMKTKNITCNTITIKDNSKSACTINSNTIEVGKNTTETVIDGTHAKIDFNKELTKPYLVIDGSGKVATADISQQDRFNTITSNNTTLNKNTEIKGNISFNINPSLSQNLTINNLSSSGKIKYLSVDTKGKVSAIDWQRDDPVFDTLTVSGEGLSEGDVATQLNGSVTIKNKINATIGLGIKTDKPINFSSCQIQGACSINQNSGMSGDIFVGSSTNNSSINIAVGKTLKSISIKGEGNLLIKGNNFNFSDKKDYYPLMIDNNGTLQSKIITNFDLKKNDPARTGNVLEILGNCLFDLSKNQNKIKILSKKDRNRIIISSDSNFKESKNTINIVGNSKIGNLDNSTQIGNYNSALTIGNNNMQFNILGSSCIFDQRGNSSPIPFDLKVKNNFNIYANDINLNGKNFSIVLDGVSKNIIIKGPIVVTSGLLWKINLYKADNIGEDYYRVEIKNPPTPRVIKKINKNFFNYDCEYNDLNLTCDDIVILEIEKIKLLNNKIIELKNKIEILKNVLLEYEKQYM